MKDKITVSIIRVFHCIHLFLSVCCSVLGESPGSGGGGGPVDMDSIELTVMDDVHSPDSPHVQRHPTKDGSNNSNSSDEDDSSGSEEDRYSVHCVRVSLTLERLC